jgi:hypothetical protein
MRFRKLRIAWSVGWGVLALILIGLWIHSHWYKLSALCWISKSATVDGSYWEGYLQTRYEWFGPYNDTSEIADTGISFDYGNQRVPGKYPVALWMWHDYSEHGGIYWYLQVPFWFPVVISACLGSLPWVRWSRQFSLRTLLVAMTLVAIVLGMIAVMYR